MGRIDEAPHAEGRGDACDALTDVAEPHDAHRLAIKLNNGRLPVAEVFAARPVPCLHAGIMQTHLIR